MSINILETNNLYKEIGRKKIINDVSFNIKKGEIVGLLGPNGAGKTTIMKMILGLTNFSKGEIIYDGNNIQSDKGYLKTIGAIIETPKFYPFLTGIENLKYLTTLYKNVDKIQFKKMIKLMDLEHAINKKVKHYSLGMKQRLGLVQALIHEPNLLILDEPLNGLDPYGIKDFRDYLKCITKESDAAILISSHLITEMEMLCDKIIFLKDGSVIEKTNISNLKVNNIIKVNLYLNNASKAQKLLKDSYGEFYFLDGEDNVLQGKVAKDEINNLLTILIKNNIKIFEIKRINESLEELFIQYTGGNSIV
ncbi:ABC transporter ATP-binding protein [Bacillus xiapuensis]|uniref:ABC transporter ATP-binding protein n=1 Tax=Bacillus xiapuensis TaxID=2014075 RepID=UPI000C24D619|nr:ABC transporter ATP-binding protein [Bacillus xiapuensis]